ncbi:hypothetical protein SAMN03097719_3216 [Pantoea ananatis]|uniref:hypothetical protein n=1 Tax=Pantoea ananas TaxID=553 RepID=UPI00099C3BB6|nr:hypothetical protein [Pantoea ananatis]SKA79314.1 hypothetical protein SAMN03097719_3216 [Pantoea ananatis]
MKVLQTLGSWQGAGSKAGVFKYRRYEKGIDLIPYNNSRLPPIIITHSSWEVLLVDLSSLKNKTISLDDLKDEIKTSLSKTMKISQNHTPAIAAILEHEGSVDHYGGGKGGAKISLNIDKN